MHLFFGLEDLRVYIRRCVFGGDDDDDDDDDDDG